MIIKCVKCNKEEDSDRWSSEWKKSIEKYQLCHTCNFWREQLEFDKKRIPYGWAVINGTHYVLCPHTNDYFKGYGGHKFKIRFFDGTVKECDNLWCQGDIDEEWLEEFPDNAEFVNEKN